MLILANLRTVRRNHGLQPAQLSSLSGVLRPRLERLELHARNMAEPTFIEACALARVLNTPGIMQLIDPSKSINQLGVGTPLPVDRDMFLSGIDIDLSTACRVAMLYGLHDPYQLVAPSPRLKATMWEVLEASERAPAPGHCPWCAADVVAGPHLPTCLPAALLTRRGTDKAANVINIPTPQARGTGYPATGIAHGLRRIREDHSYTQAQMGALIGKSSDYYSKFERGVVPMRVSHAQRLANALGIDAATVYRMDLSEDVGAGA